MLLLDQPEFVSRFLRACTPDADIDEPEIIRIFHSLFGEKYQIDIVRHMDDIPPHSTFETLEHFQYHYQHNSIGPFFKWERTPLARCRFNLYLVHYNAVDISLSIAVGGKDMPNSIRLRLLDALEAGAWCFVITPVRIVIVPKPSIASLDNLERFHSETGPALQILDKKMYAWHGINVDEAIIMEPETITFDQVFYEQNVEMRRVLLGRYGAERFMRHFNPFPISQCSMNGREYTLYCRQQTYDEPLVMLKVINATAEPDGTFKDYWLRVPPDVEDAFDALAWTFNLTTDEYQNLEMES